jgi:NADP-dependent 3-hydroxy acid dehydrogenase YdfG
VTELGRLDTLVNNAGVVLLGPIESVPVSEWQRMIEIDLFGLLYRAMPRCRATAVATTTRPSTALERSASRTARRSPAATSGCRWSHGPGRTRG